MILDNENLFSDAQALTTTAPSTNVVDLGADHDIGDGEHMTLRVQVREDLVGTGTLTVTLETDDNEAFSSPTTLYQGPADSLVGDIAAGTILADVHVPSETQRYLRVNYTLSVAATDGNVDAFLTKDGQSRATKHYASGFSIDT